MTLPDPPWLTLHEAIELVMAHVRLADEGRERSSVEKRLSKAFWYKEIGTRGMARGFRARPGWLSIPDQFWQFGRIDWSANKIISNGDDDDPPSFTHVEVRRADLTKWLGQATHSSKSPAYRSPYMALMLAAEAHFGTRLAPSAERALIKDIDHWLREHWGEFIEGSISNNRISAMAGLIRNPELGKGGNKKFK